MGEAEVAMNPNRLGTAEGVQEESVARQGSMLTTKGKYWKY